MERFDYFEKINIPVCICDGDWTVVFRNTACKKYARSPRCGSNMKRRFLEGDGVDFPDSNSDMFFVSCRVNDTYRTAICFGYRNLAVLSFPTLIDYDMLFADIMNRQGGAMAEQVRYLIDNAADENADERERVTGVIEKLRKNIYSAIENYVALAAFETEKRVPASFSMLYRFLTERFVSVANKAGFRVAVDLEGLAELGDTVYTDTLYFATALASVMLFCLEISGDRKCLVAPQHLGDRIRNTVRFKCRRITSDLGIAGGLSSLARLFPVEYLNLLPIDQLCAVLGWDITLDIDEKEELNCTLNMDIAIDNRLIFKSAGNTPALDPMDIISQVISSIVFPKK